MIADERAFCLVLIRVIGIYLRLKFLSSIALRSSPHIHHGRIGMKNRIKLYDFPVKGTSVETEILSFEKAEDRNFFTIKRIKDKYSIEFNTRSIIIPASGMNCRFTTKTTFSTSYLRLPK